MTPLLKPMLNVKHSPCIGIFWIGASGSNHKSDGENYLYHFGFPSLSVGCFFFKLHIFDSLLKDLGAIVLQMIKLKDLNYRIYVGQIKQHKDN